METLIVENDEAYVLAQELAERRGTTLGEAVVASLRESLRETDTARRPEGRHATSSRIPTVEELTPEQRARYESLRALACETASRARPGSTSDHSDLYDDFGLPK